MIDDVMNKLKVKRGEQLKHSKLTDHDVKLIRDLITHREELRRQASELTAAKIAEKFGVHVRTIDRVSTGENWGHVV